VGEHLDQLARLRTATATGTLPRDLGMWALDLLAELEPAAERVERRNALLREAASRVSGSRWARANRLEQEIRALGMHPRLRERAVDDGVRELVARALDVDPDAPCSVRQLFRLLGAD
jgi:hypothetical protein